MGSLLYRISAGTCYFYYSHAVLHKYGWEMNSRATYGVFPRAVKMAEPAYVLQQEIAAYSGSALLPRSGRCAEAQRSHYSRFRKNCKYNQKFCAQNAPSGGKARFVCPPAACRGVNGFGAFYWATDFSETISPPSMHTQFLTALAR